MAREGITYRDVELAADAVLASGRRPSIRNVREQLGDTGSPNTIQQHLKKWSEGRPGTQAAVPDLPPSILREINAEILRAVTAGRAELQAELADAKAEATYLATTGAELETFRDDLLEQVARLTRERDIAEGKAAEQGAEIERLTQELDRERRAAEEARIQVAQSRLTVDAQVKQLQQLQAENAKAAEAVSQERQGRTDAERNLAAARAESAGLNDRLQELQGREQAALQEVTDLRSRLEQGASEARATVGELAKAASERDALQGALSRANSEIDRMRSDAEQQRTQLTGEIERLRQDVEQQRDRAQASALKVAQLTGEIERTSPPAGPEGGSQAAGSGEQPRTRKRT